MGICTASAPCVMKMKGKRKKEHGKKLKIQKPSKTNFILFYLRSFSFRPSTFLSAHFRSVLLISLSYTHYVRSVSKDQIRERKEMERKSKPKAKNCYEKKKSNLFIKGKQAVLLSSFKNKNKILNKGKKEHHYC